ncbi:hypothetical protein NCER_100297 [Vairimorpha ceranae BRL01]|uniref:Uncharacterized protein n=1 Tax=Vairimorpha ceranae (strain BRL01) TaxID=578460 RepID=C4V775_VAIC1|nr:hypothetical protein NCER_100297 [Vairimorpha ceranae BRL01]
MFKESLGKLLNIIQSEDCYKIQIISREDIKTFIKFLDYNNITFYLHSWNASSDSPNDIHIYTSLKNLNLNHKKIILYSNIYNINFVQYVFTPTYTDKLMFYKSYKNSKKVIDTYNTYTIHELYNKICIQESIIEKYVEIFFDYYEVLLLYAVSKYSDIFKILSCVQGIDEKIQNLFLLKLKLNGLVDKEIVLHKNNAYKLNVSIQTLAKICNKAELNIFA